MADIKDDTPEIFVFGSNEAGIHGAGSAAAAYKYHGAIWGQGSGPQGNSYAIPTKGQLIVHGGAHIGPPLPLIKIASYVDDFIDYADEHFNTLKFKVTCIGTGHAGFIHEQIAPLFENCPDNCSFDEVWRALLGIDKKYWGTF